MDLNNLRMQAHLQIGVPIQAIQNKVSTLAKPAQASLKEFLIRKTGLEALGFNVIDAGAAKIVLLSNTKIPPSGLEDASAVYYVPVRKFLFDKTQELKNEFKKMSNIADRITHNVKGKTGDLSKLALTAEELKGDERVKGHYTLKVARAESNLEKAILGKVVLRNADGQAILNAAGEPQFVDYTHQETLNFLSDVLEAGANFHLSDFAYGDLKPENFLVFREADGKTHVKLADFGKAEEVGQNGSKLYKGNLRFAPPEGVLSQKGDVFGFGLVMVRLLEQKMINGDGSPLLDISLQESESVTADDTKRFGLERYIVNHKAFKGLDEPSLMDKLFRRLPRAATLSTMPKQYKQNQKELLHSYVAVLQQKWKEANQSANPKLTDEQIADTCKLIAQMLEDEPAKRPTMQAASDRFSQIMAGLVPITPAPN